MSYLPRKRNKPALRGRGLTFIEILIVVVMMSIVSLAVYSTLSKAISIWQTVQRPLYTEDFALFFEKFSSDIKNAMLLKTVAAAGHDDSFEFASLVPSRIWKKRIPGKIIYSFDKEKGVLVREQLDVVDLYSEKDPLRQEVLKNIRSLQFLYYTYDQAQKEYIWLEEWVREGLPLAVRISGEVNAPGEHNGFVRSVSLPVGG
jgi:prepilin-type N-terminal cleavage/methylation domain-containing protein